MTEVLDPTTLAPSDPVPANALARAIDKLLVPARSGQAGLLRLSWPGLQGDFVLNVHGKAVVDVEGPVLLRQPQLGHAVLTGRLSTDLTTLRGLGLTYDRAAVEAADQLEVRLAQALHVDLRVS